MAVMAMMSAVMPVMPAVMPVMTAVMTMVPMMSIVMAMVTVMSFMITMMSTVAAAWMPIPDAWIDWLLGTDGSNDRRSLHGYLKLRHPVVADDRGGLADGRREGSVVANDGSAAVVADVRTSRAFTGIAGGGRRVGGE
jgi:hypothetical protein